MVGLDRCRRQWALAHAFRSAANGFSEFQPHPGEGQACPFSTGGEESGERRNEVSNGYENNEVGFDSDIVPVAVGTVMALVRRLSHACGSCGLCRGHVGFPGRPHGETLLGARARDVFAQGEI